MFKKYTRKKKNSMLPTLSKVDSTDYSLIFIPEDGFLFVSTVWDRGIIRNGLLKTEDDIIASRKSVIVPHILSSLFPMILDDEREKSVETYLEKCIKEVFDIQNTQNVSENLGLTELDIKKRLIGDPKLPKIDLVKQHINDYGYTMIYHGSRNTVKKLYMAKVIQSNREVDEDKVSYDLTIGYVRYITNKKEKDIVMSFDFFTLPEELIKEFVKKEKEN